MRRHGGGGGGVICRFGVLRRLTPCTWMVRVGPSININGEDHVDRAFGYAGAGCSAWVVVLCGIIAFGFGVLLEAFLSGRVVML